MQERYGQIIESGLLWYLGSASPQQVRLVPAEIQALIMHRNALAGHLLPGQALPAVIRDDWACSKCFQKAACALSHKVRSNPVCNLLAQRQMRCSSAYFTKIVLSFLKQDVAMSVCAAYVVTDNAQYMCSLIGLQLIYSRESPGLALSRKRHAACRLM